MAAQIKIQPYCEELEDGSLRYNFTPPQMRAMTSLAKIIALLCGAQFGKALDAETPIPTINGFVKLRDIVVGDVLFDERGNPCVVTAVTPIMTNHQCYEVIFDDGFRLVADEEHLWRTQTHNQRKNQSRWLEKPSRKYDRLPSFSIVTTENILKTLRFHGGSNHSIEYPLPAKYPERELPIPPYTLGVWLGDGTARTPHVTCADLEIIEQIRKDGMQVSDGREGHSGKALRYSIDTNQRGQVAVVDVPFIAKIRELKLYRNKHIPQEYLIASPEQRLSLLQGLMDTDGSVSSQSGSCELTLKDNQLAHDTICLMRSLGIKTRIYDKHIEGYGNFVRVSFTTNLDVFRLSRKRNIQQGRKRRTDIKNRYIDSVTPCNSVPVRCIQVDSPSRLYLAGDGYVPTHNTILGPPWMQMKMSQYGDGDYLAGTSNFPLLDKKMLPAYEELFDFRLGVAKYKDKGNKMVWHDGKTQIFFCTAEKPSSMESATAICAHWDEVGQDEWKEKSWQAGQSRLAIASNAVEEGGLGAGDQLLTTTLYNFGWLKYLIYDVWDRETEGGKYPERSLIEVIHADSIENPTFPLKKYYEFKASYSESDFDLRYRGRYTRPKGMIYDSFDSKTAVLARKLSPVQDSWPVYCGVDFGTDATAAVFYAVDPATGFYYCTAEYFGTGKTTAENVAELEKICPRSKIIKCCGGKGDTDDDGWRGDFAKAGWSIQMPSIRSVEQGIRRVYAFHKLGKLFYFIDDTRILAEKASYSQKLDEKGDPTGEIINKQRYHFMDAERYILSEFNLTAASRGLRRVWDY